MHLHIKEHNIKRKSQLFPRGVLDEILNLIESVSEGFPSYSFNFQKPNLTLP